MNSKQTIIAAFLAASAAFLGVAHAMGGPEDCGMRPGGRHAMMRDGDMAKISTERMEARLDRLKYELRITQEQEPLWKAFAEKSVSGAGSGRAVMQSDAAKKMTAPERMELMQSMMKSRLASMQGANDAFKRLYAALSPEQKARADEHFGRMGGGPGRGPMGGMGPARMGPGGMGPGGMGPSGMGMMHEG